jgi:integral membrane protein
MKKHLRWLGWAEGTSFLVLLLIAMPLKYIWGKPLAVSIVGMAHGILFILYFLSASEAATDYRWSLKVRLYAYLAAIMPLGTFVFEKKFLSKPEYTTSR